MHGPTVPKILRSGEKMEGYRKLVGIIKKAAEENSSWNVHIRS